MAIAFDVTIQGDSLNDKGFEAYKTVEGLGLVTAGFLWPIEGIWGPGEKTPELASAWIACTDA